MVRYYVELVDRESFERFNLPYIMEIESDLKHNEFGYTPTVKILHIEDAIFQHIVNDSANPWGYVMITKSGTVDSVNADTIKSIWKEEEGTTTIIFER